MGRYIDSTVSLRTGKAIHMVILIDRTSYCTKTIMAVGQHIRNRELSKSACSGCLKDTDKGNIMRGQLIKFYFYFFHTAGGIMLLQYIIGHRTFPCSFLMYILKPCFGFDFCGYLRMVRNHLGSVQEIYSLIKQINHSDLSFMKVCF